MRRTLAEAAAVLCLIGGAAAAEVDLERWQKLSDAGIAQADKGDYAAAEVSLRQAYDVAKEMREADPRRAATANNLGFVLHAEGRPQDACRSTRSRSPCARLRSGPTTRAWRRA